MYTYHVQMSTEALVRIFSSNNATNCSIRKDFHCTCRFYLRRLDSSDNETSNTLSRKQHLQITPPPLFKNVSNLNSHYRRNRFKTSVRATTSTLNLIISSLPGKLCDSATATIKCTAAVLATRAAFITDAVFFTNCSS
mmetsp:Transcript_20628/g.30379  ORF Transcript_20628/g.30379 Transcript_20628/m.30379 type:complete len:138 (+) Transcript_20628:57-470(+)